MIPLSPASAIRHSLNASQSTTRTDLRQSFIGYFIDGFNTMTWNVQMQELKSTMNNETMAVVATEVFFRLFIQRWITTFSRDVNLFVDRLSKRLLCWASSRCGAVRCNCNAGRFFLCAREQSYKFWINCVFACFWLILHIFLGSIVNIWPNYVIAVDYDKFDGKKRGHKEISLQNGAIWHDAIVRFFDCRNLCRRFESNWNAFTFRSNELPHGCVVHQTNRFGFCESAIRDSMQLKHYPRDCIHRQWAHYCY